MRLSSFLFLMGFLVLLPSRYARNQEFKATDSKVPPIPKMTWQQSQEKVVKLGVRNKYGWLEFFTATFIIEEPDGKQKKLVKRGKGDEWIDVYFPEDFDTYEKAGEYKWKALVEGHIVVHGKFNAPNLPGVKRR